MKSEPLISVIIPCYNQEKTIARTIDSVLMQQTKYLFEIIIGEDASTSDNTRDICEKYVLEHPNIIHLMPKTQNKGLLKNYSDCVDVCRGKYISVCAGDDWWHDTNKLEIQVDFLENNLDYGLVYTDFNTIDVDTSKEVNNFYTSKQIIPPSGKIYEDLIKGNVILACTTLFRKSLFIEHIDFSMYISLGFLMDDYPMWLEISQHTKIKYIPLSTTTYSIQNGSISNNLNDFKKFKKFEESVYEIKKYYISKYPIQGINEELLLEYLYLNLIMKCIRGRHFNEAKYYSRKFNKISPRNLFLKTICFSPLFWLYSFYLNR